MRKLTYLQRLKLIDESHERQLSIVKQFLERLQYDLDIAKNKLKEATSKLDEVSENHRWMIEEFKKITEKREQKI